MSYIPENSSVAIAVRDAIDMYKSGITWQEARDKMLAKHRGWGFYYEDDTVKIDHVSKEDYEKGLGDGKIGWDIPANVGIIIIGLLYGEGDFAKTLCTAVNCGEDTDCTAATLGSIFGIMHGYEPIPQEWKTPIGSKIITACLNLGELGIYGSQLPQSIEELTERVFKIAKQVVLRNNLMLEISETKQNDFSDVNLDVLYAGKLFKSKYNYANGPEFKFDFYNITVDYCEGAMIRDNQTKKIVVTIENKYKIQEIINVQWYKIGGWSVLPAESGKVYVAQTCFENHKKRIEFTVLTEKVPNKTNRFVIEFTLEGRNTVMLVPVVLLNGNL